MIFDKINIPFWKESIDPLFKDYDREKVKAKYLLKLPDIDEIQWDNFEKFNSYRKANFIKYSHNNIVADINNFTTGSSFNNQEKKDTIKIIEKKVVEAGSASVEDVSESADLINVFSMKIGAVSEKMEQDYERETGFVKIHLEEVIKRLDKKEELNEDELEERCQKGYKTHPTRKTKKMYGKTYRNCVKAE